MRRIWSATRPVHPVWCVAPKPSPVSPLKYSLKKRLSFHLSPATLNEHEDVTIGDHETGAYMVIVDVAGCACCRRRLTSGRARPGVHAVKSTVGISREQVSTADRGAQAPGRRAGPAESSDSRQSG